MQKERSRDCSRYIYGSIRPSWILQHAGYMSASEDLGEDPTLLTQVVSLVQLCCGICAMCQKRAAGCGQTTGTWRRRTSLVAQLHFG